MKRITSQGQHIHEVLLRLPDSWWNKHLEMLALDEEREGKTGVTGEKQKYILHEKNPARDQFHKT